MLAILGANGAGKTTLIRLLSSISRPSSGRVVVGDWESGQLGRQRQVFRERLGFVPQSLDIASAYTAADFLRYACWLKRIPPRLVAGRVDDSLARFDLTEFADKRIRALSGGSRQRLVLAQATVNEPSVIILDEPTVGLDPVQRIATRRYLSQLSEKSVLILATHLIEDVAALADEILMLREGELNYWGGLDSFCVDVGVPVEGTKGPTGSQLERALVARLAMPAA